MDQVLSSQACCHWAYNGEKYGKFQISFCTLTNTVPNKAPRSQLQGTYSKVAAWLHACSLPFKNKTLEQMLPSDRNAVRKCRQLVLFLCTIFKKQCFFKFSNTQRIPYTRVVCSVFTKICLGIIRKVDNAIWWNFCIIRFFKGADWCPPSRATQISFIHFLCLNHVAAIYFCVCKQYDYRFRPGEHTNNNGYLLVVTNMGQIPVFSFCLQTWTSSFVIFINHNWYSYVENSSFSSRNVQSFYNLCVLARPRPRPS